MIEFVRALRGGLIGALKGLGGYHLVCDATNPAAVRELRRRKERNEKPLAVMVSDIEMAASLCHVDPAERALLRSPRRPIVLLRKLPTAALADEVAPGHLDLGLMLPYTPLHHLLLQEAGLPLVMTSGNRRDEPIACDDDDARERLADIADLFLLHDRPIHVRCDDSVTRVLAGGEYLVRRSRGYAPAPIALPFACPVPMLAVGGQLKATFALGRERLAFLSHHLGDLDHFQAHQAFVRDIDLYQRLLAIEPRLLVHDLHPDYQSTIYARQRGAEQSLDLLAVQHHHAHMAACMAEHGLPGPVIGVTFDGTGHGSDGAVWGGEFLVGDYRHVRRAAHLRYVGMPGGDQAIREPWRMALAHLVDAGCASAALEGRLPAVQVRTVRHMIERGLHTPLTSSAGRLFDAVAALAGLRDRASYEGQAACLLEQRALLAAPAGSYPFDILAGDDRSPSIVDTRPLMRALAEDARRLDPGCLARRFHSTVVDIIAAVCTRLRRATGVSDVVLSGGVFLNVLLTVEATARLDEAGFRVYRQRLVPPGDGGLCLGQLAVAAAQRCPPGAHAPAAPI